jgi:hypothetical protein
MASVMAGYSLYMYIIPFPCLLNVWQVIYIIFMTVGENRKNVFYVYYGTPNQLFPFTFMGFVFGALANATLWVKFRALLAWPGLMGVCLF